MKKYIVSYALNPKERERKIKDNEKRGLTRVAPTEELMDGQYQIIKEETSTNKRQHTIWEFREYKEDEASEV